MHTSRTPARGFCVALCWLALSGTGDGHAVASRGPFAAHGAALWRLKDWIDRRWMRRYRELPEMATGEAEDPMRCGGCAAKVPAASRPTPNSGGRNIGA